MFPKTFIFFAVSFLTAASASNLDNILHSVVPKFIDSAFEIFSQNFGEHHTFEKRNNRILRRDTHDDQVHVFDAYDIGHTFKAISVKFEEFDIVKNLLRTFDDEILKIIPDEDITVKLPKPKKSSIHKRYQIRSSNATAPIVRAGNFNYDHYEHDENCTHNLSKRETSKGNNCLIKKRVPKKTAAKKTTDKRITAKKITTMKARARKTSVESITSYAGYSQQPSPQWNLARISERRRNYNRPYVYSATAGADVTVYVLDDGMNTNHVDFEGRAKWGWSIFQGESPYGGGHGTHVAGIIGGRTYGVSKKTKLIAVQVLNSQGRGPVSGFLARLQWVADHRSKHNRGKAVINMSLGAGTQGMGRDALAAFNQAISAVVKEGIPIIAAAGNENTDSCNVLPAANRDVFTVAASGIDDDMSYYSNYGSCVQIIAPGTNIKSTYIGSTTSTAVMSGTSMASPHVAGVAALLMGDLSNPSPGNVYRELTRLATRNIVSRIKSSTPNILLFNGSE